MNSAGSNVYMCHAPSPGTETSRLRTISFPVAGTAMTFSVTGHWWLCGSVQRSATWLWYWVVLSPVKGRSSLIVAFEPGTVGVTWMYQVPSKPVPATRSRVALPTVCHGHMPADEMLGFRMRLRT